jgi:hypothetical protein
MKLSNAHNSSVLFCLEERKEGRKKSEEARKGGRKGRKRDIKEEEGRGRKESGK